eukprot:jgi/Mesvir1/23405/Mv25954-RA.1
MEVRTCRYLIRICWVVQDEGDEWSWKCVALYVNTIKETIMAG